MMFTGLFKGPERIEPFMPTGLPIRKGSPDELAVSDTKRVRDALEKEDFRLASRYLELQYRAHATMLSIYTQWPCAYVVAALQNIDNGAVMEIAVSARDHWLSVVQSIEHEGAIERRAVELVRQFLSPVASFIDEAAVRLTAYRMGRLPASTALIFEYYHGHKLELERAVMKGSQALAVANYERCLTSVRTFHDVLQQYTDSFPTAAAELRSQHLAETLVDQSLKLSPFSAPMWELGATLSPEELTAFLYEHIRDHFSGSGRGCSAKLIEHPDRYQLIFDPCGSGGAMRRRLKDSQYLLPDATPATFGLVVHAENSVTLSRLTSALGKAQERRTGRSQFKRLQRRRECL